MTELERRDTPVLVTPDASLTKYHLLMKGNDMAVPKGIREHVSSTNKTKQRLSSDESNSVEMEQWIQNMPPALGVNFTEAVGKIVAYINVVNNPPEWQGLEIHFTDRTFLHFEFLVTHARIQPKYMEERRGESELIRDYGILPTEAERKALR